MLSTIVSRFFFTCSTFLLLSASLFGMGPKINFEKKSEAKETAEKKDIDRFALLEKTAGNQSEDSEFLEGDNDDGRGLARNLQQCQLADGTIAVAQAKNSEYDALQDDQSSDTDNDMEAVRQEPGQDIAQAASSSHAEDKSIFQSTPQKAQKSRVVQVTPSAPLFDRKGSSSLERSKNPLDSHQITPGSPLKQQRLDGSSQRFMSKQEVQKILNNITDILDHAEKVENSFYRIYDVVNSEDYKKIEELQLALLQITSAVNALKMMKEELGQADGQQGLNLELAEGTNRSFHDSTNHFFKLRIATAALKSRIENANTIAEKLMQDREYGATISDLIRTIREKSSWMTTLLQQTFTLSDLHALNTEEVSFTSDQEMQEALGRVVHSAEDILENKKNLIETVATPALTVFGVTGDHDNQDALMKAYEKLEAMAIMMQVATENAKHFQQLSSSSSSSASIIFPFNQNELPVFATLKMTTEATDKALEEMKTIASHVHEHEESWPSDVRSILGSLKTSNR